MPTTGKDAEKLHLEMWITDTFLERILIVSIKIQMKIYICLAQQSHYWEYIS